MLRAICQCSKTDRRKLLKGVHSDVIRAICDIAKYHLKNRASSVSNTRNRKTSQRKRILHALIDPKRNIEAKRNIIKQQRGGFLFTIMDELIHRKL